MTNTVTLYDTEIIVCMGDMKVEGVGSNREEVEKNLKSAYNKSQRKCIIKYTQTVRYIHTYTLVYFRDRISQVRVCVFFSNTDCFKIFIKLTKRTKQKAL